VRKGKGKGGSEQGRERERDRERERERELASARGREIGSNLILSHILWQGSMELVLQQRGDEKLNCNCKVPFIIAVHMQV